MKKCVICGKKYVPGKGAFFKIPTDSRRRQQWSNICKKELSETEKVCADHFLPSNFIVGARCKLMPSAVPSVGIVMQTTINSLSENEVVVPNTTENTCENFGPQENSNCVHEMSAEEPHHVGSIIYSDDWLYEVKMVEENNSVAELEDKRSDSCTQTDNDVIISISETENYKLRREVKKLQNENSKLKEELKKANSVIANMRTIFTDNQIRKIGNPDKRLHWRGEDISAGMGLHACGPKAYNHLYMKGFPLPNVSSLQRWACKIEVNQESPNEKSFPQNNYNETNEKIHKEEQKGTEPDQHT